MKRLALLMAIGCGTGAGNVKQIRPVDEDPWALVPSGADAVFDFDLEQLSSWPPTQRIVEAVALADRLPHFGFDPLKDLDGALLSISDLGQETASFTWLLKGRFERAAARSALTDPVVTSDYRGSSIDEDATLGLAELAPHLWIVAPRAQVRRAIDLLHGEGDSLRSSRADRTLMGAFGRAPTAKQGRPAILFAVVPSDVVRKRLRDENWALADAEWLAGALAVGDGFDLVAVAGARSEAIARVLLDSSHAALKQLKDRPLIRLLGLRPFLDPIVIVARPTEARLAYRLPQSRVEALIQRLETFGKQGKAVR